MTGKLKSSLKRLKTLKATCFNSVS